MSTINIHNTIWNVGSANKKVSFSYQNVSVEFDIEKKKYAVKSNNGMHFADASAAACLHAATHAVLDAYAAQIIPSWEM